MKKKCFKCLQEKPISHFYKHAQMADGYLNKCKECAKTDALEVRNNNIEYYQKYDRERSNTPERIALRKEVAERWKKDPQLKKRRNELKKLWQERNVIKRAAHVITGHAIRDGRLLPELCAICGKEKVDAHHEDYTKPLDVIWLCKKHHAELHKRKREEQRRILGA